jgi:hypothetical protein
VEALGLGRTLSPDAPPAAISSAVMDMLGDEALRAASRSFASGVSRCGELTLAADLIERAVDHVLGSAQGIGDNAARITTASAGQCLPTPFCDEFRYQVDWRSLEVERAMGIEPTRTASPSL